MSGGTRGGRRGGRAWLGILTPIVLLTLAGASWTPPVEAATGSTCSMAGTWSQGELNVYWLDVEQATLS